MYNSQYYTCEQIDQRLLQGYLDDYNSQHGTNLTKSEFLNLLHITIGRNNIIDNLVTQVGYYECDTAAGTAAKAIIVANYNLFAGGSMKVKFVNKNTANNATLNINSQGAKALYYQGERASSTNSWDEGEVVEIYYDGTNYYANNVKGGSGSGVYDVSVEHPTSGPNEDGKFTLEYILKPSNVNELTPVNKRYSGMSIQFVSIYDNKYVQYRYLLEYANNAAGNAAFINPDNWQGVDKEPIAGSKNLAESGGVYFNEKLLNQKIGESSIPIIENGKYIDLSGGVGTVAPINNPLVYASYNYAIQECHTGDVVIINGTGGSIGRLWALLDDENTILAVADANATASGLVLVIPFDAVKVVINDLSNSSSYILKDDCPDSKIKDLNNILGADKQDTDYIFSDFSIRGYTFNTDGEEFQSSNPSWGITDYIPVNLGAKINAFLVNGHNTSAIVVYDKDKNVVREVIGIGDYAECTQYPTVTIQDGESYVRFANLGSVSESCKVHITNYTTRLDGFDNKVSENAQEIEMIKDELYEESISLEEDITEEALPGYITTNIDSVNVNNVIIDPNHDYTHIVKECKPGDKFHISAAGGVSPLLWCFLDKNSNRINGGYQDPANPRTMENVHLTAPDGTVMVVLNFWRTVAIATYQSCTIVKKSRLIGINNDLRLIKDWLYNDENPRFARKQNHYDVIICGGGAAGIACGYALINSGLRVALIESQNFLGGTHTLGWINVWQPTAAPSFVRSIFDEVEAIGEAAYCDTEHTPLSAYARGYMDYYKTFKGRGIQNYDLLFMVYNPIAMAIKYYKDLSPYMDIFLSTKIVSATKDGTEIKTVTTNDGSIFSADRFIDCTANDVLLSLTGASLLVGTDSKTEYEGEYGFTESCAANNHYNSINQPNLNYRVTKGLEDLSAISAAYNARAAYMAFQNNPKEYYINSLNEIVPTDPYNLVTEGIDYVHDKFCPENIRHWKTLKNNAGYSTTFSTYKYNGNAPMLGIRELYRAKCERLLNQNNIFTQITNNISAENNLDSIIAVGTHEYDLQYGTNLVDYATLRANLKPFGVPYGIMVPKGYTNVLVASRGAGMTHIALAPFRLTKEMMQLGWAAGWATRIAVLDSETDYRDVDIDKLQSSNYADVAFMVSKVVEIIEEVNGNE